MRVFNCYFFFFFAACSRAGILDEGMFFWGDCVYNCDGRNRLRSAYSANANRDVSVIAEFIGSL